MIIISADRQDVASTPRRNLAKFFFIDFLQVSNYLNPKEIPFFSSLFLISIPLKNKFEWCEWVVLTPVSGRYVMYGRILCP